MAKKIKNVCLEALIQELSAKGKTGIKLPYTEKETKKYLCFLKQLLQKKMLTKQYYDKEVEERKRRTLDPKLYKKFYNALLIKS